MTGKDLLIEMAGGVAVLTVNRPQAMNNMTSWLRQELMEAFQRIRESDEIRVVIITGQGEKAFISGAEIDAKIAGPISARNDAQKGQSLTTLIEKLPKPVIAAVNGPALGGGMEIMLACDFCIASENAMFGLPEVKLGFIPGWGGTQRITRSLGKKGAMQLALLGELVMASEAYRMGLVNQVVSSDKLMDEAHKLANKLLTNSPFAMAQVKKAILAGMEVPLNEGLELEAELEGVCFDSEDKTEGIKAFLERRKPNFTGR